MAAAANRSEHLTIGRALRGPASFCRLNPIHAPGAMWRASQVDRCLFSGPCETGSFARSLQGWIYGGPENKCDPRLNVFTVEEYESNGKTAKKWTRIGAAFPHKEGLGFSIEPKAFPIDGRLVVLPPDTDDSTGRNGK
jgi:hypothetical protein